MKKKIFYILFAFIFCIIFAFHYKLNHDERSKPPSPEWAKEVLLLTGEITTSPDIIAYKNNFIITYNNKNTINILYVDPFGKKLKEKSFPAQGENPQHIYMLQSNKNLYLSWTVNDGMIKNAHLLTLDENFAITEQNKIENITRSTQVNHELLVISDHKKIHIFDFHSGKDTAVTINGASLVAGTKLKEKYIITYLEGSNMFNYFYLQDGKVTAPKPAGLLASWSRVTFLDAILISEEKNASIIVPYRYQSEFAGAKILHFSLEKEDATATDLTINGMFVNLSSAVPFKSGKECAFLASSPRPYAKKHLFTDILEFTVKDGKVNPGIPLSRSSNLSLYSAAYENTVVYADYLDGKTCDLYMTSKDAKFKEKHNILRFKEKKLALIDTLQSLLFAVVYLLPYGSSWIIPSIVIASLYALIEYRYKDKGKLLMFVLIYAITALIKSRFIYKVSFQQYVVVTPKFITPTIGMGICLFISILCCIYGYLRYREDTHGNVMAISFSSTILIDSLLTLMVFVPFIK